MSSDATDNTMRADLAREIAAIDAADAVRTAAAHVCACPFCSGNPTLVDRTDGPMLRGAYVVCRECNVSTPLHPTAKSAIAAWNRRADTRRGDITGAEVWTVIDTHMRARDAGSTPGTSNWAIAILRALRAMPPIDNTGLSKPDRAPSEDGYRG